MKKFFKLFVLLCAAMPVFSQAVADIAQGETKYLMAGDRNLADGVYTYIPDYKKHRFDNLYLNGGVFLTNTLNNTEIFVNGLGVWLDKDHPVSFPVRVVNDPSWLSYVSMTNDEFVTVWMLDRKVDDVLNYITLVGRTDFIERYEAYPPTNTASAVEYLHECVEILSSVKVEADASFFTNRLNEVVSVLTTDDGVFSLNSNNVRDLKDATSNLTESVDLMLGRPWIGSGASDLDWILEMDIDTMSMVELRKALRAIVLYIKTGNTTGYDDE